VNRRTARPRGGAWRECENTVMRRCRNVAARRRRTSKPDEALFPTRQTDASLHLEQNGNI
jgi:hypothetical protein